MSLPAVPVMVQADDVLVAADVGLAAKPMPTVVATRAA
jgi:hypothetical protein